MLGPGVGVRDGRVGGVGPWLRSRAAPTTATAPTEPTASANANSIANACARNTTGRPGPKGDRPGVPSSREQAPPAVWASAQRRSPPSPDPRSRRSERRTPSRHTTRGRARSQAARHLRGRHRGRARRVEAAARVAHRSVPSRRHASARGPMEVRLDRPSGRPVRARSRRAMPRRRTAARRLPGTARGAPRPRSGSPSPARHGAQNRRIGQRGGGDCLALRGSISRGHCLRAETRAVRVAPDHRPSSPCLTESDTHTDACEPRPERPVASPRRERAEPRHQCLLCRILSLRLVAEFRWHARMRAGASRSTRRRYASRSPPRTASTMARSSMDVLGAAVDDRAIVDAVFGVDREALSPSRRTRGTRSHPRVPSWLGDQSEAEDAHFFGDGVPLARDVARRRAAWGRGSPAWVCVSLSVRQGDDGRSSGATRTARGSAPEAVSAAPSSRGARGPSPPPG